MNVCPKNAIRMAEDEVGFVYPEIDQNLCVGCGACKKACGYQTQPLMQKSEAVYGKNVIWRNKTMLFLVFFILVALLVALKGNKKFILFFMAFYPVLPDYFAIELGGGLPLLKASRILLLILMLCVCFHNKKIHLIRQPLKVTGLYWPLFIYFAARILANGYYAPSLSAAINTEFTVIVEQLLLIVMICQVVLAFGPQFRGNRSVSGTGVSAVRRKIYRHQ